MTQNWHNPTTNSEAYHRAGGRRRYNLDRRIAMTDRRYRLLFHWAQHPSLNQGDLARFLKVSRATICRDIAWLKQQELTGHCPLCDGAMTRPAGIKQVMFVHQALRIVGE